MSIAQLEHVNVTVSDPDATAAWMQDVFGWHIRWKGASSMGGVSIHVGSDTRYIALYEPGSAQNRPGHTSYTTTGGLNHIAVVVDDLAETEARVKAAGFTPGEHHDYEPGERFYFDDTDGIEFEVVCYK